MNININTNMPLRAHAGKLYDKWNEKKKMIDQKEIADKIYFKEGEIWWIQLGCNIGCETDGKGEDFMRPVLILKKYNQYSFLALPLSTTGKINKYNIPIGIVDGKNAAGKLSQLRNIDAKRLVNKIGIVDNTRLNEIKEKASRVNFG